MTSYGREQDENDSTANHHGGYGSIDMGGSNVLPPAGSPAESFEKMQLTYTNLLKKNSNFRYFLISYVVNKMVSDIEAEDDVGSNQACC